MKCPSFKILVDFWEGILPPRAAARVKAHLDGCASCAQDLKFLEEVLGRAGGSPLVPPPTSLVKRALVAFKGERNLVQRLVAKPALDNRQLPGYAEVRTGGIKPVYLLYRAAGVDIDLLVQSGKDGERRDILGQVSGGGEETADLQYAEVRLAQGQVVVRSTWTDEWGEFSFQDLPPGRYNLKVDLGMREVEVRDLPVEGFLGGF